MLRFLAINSFRQKSFTTTISPSSALPKRIDRLYDGLLGDDAVKRRVALASAITLIETKHPVKRKHAEILLSRLLEAKPRPAFRIGLTGPPGAGKSTYIEALGTYLTKEKNLNVAVLAIDPSSSKTGGSLLGDKTRM